MQIVFAKPARANVRKSLAEPINMFDDVRTKITWQFDGNERAITIHRLRRFHRFQGETNGVQGPDYCQFKLSESVESA